MRDFFENLYTVVKAASIDIYSYFKPNSKIGVIRLIILLILISGLIFYIAKSEEAISEEMFINTPVVTVANISDISSQSTFTLVGSVDAVSQADLKSEVSGQITTVPVTLGQSVDAGAIIVTFENRSEYASLLQAEGAYEAALAAAAQSDVGVGSAENALNAAIDTALSTYNAAYITMQTAYSNTLDEIFADPENTYRTPGFIPRDFEFEEGLVDDLYFDFQKKLDAQNALVPSVQNVDFIMTTATSDVRSLIELVRLLSSLIADGDIDETQSVVEGQYLATLATLEQTLVSTKSSLDGARTNLDASRKALEQAKISGTNGGVSAADARVKQALGSLRAAQAAYAKTIVRSPITGIINELSVKSGDFVGQQSRIALVANNDALEISTYVGENDRDRLKVGMKVNIENGVSGIVTAIAPAVDSVTKKYEVKIASESALLNNGDTVTIQIQNDTAKKVTNNTAPILVPITAVKFTHTNGVVFTVEEGVLLAHDVELGSVRGAFIEVVDGIDSNQIIVIDARGLSVGQTVETITQK